MINEMRNRNISFQHQVLLKIKEKTVRFARVPT